MPQEWKQEVLQQYIDNKIQESLVLDYKAADALQKKEEKKKEVTKDISAMANSAGGIIIYGIKEFSEKSASFLPEAIDPINQTEITKEWLQQVINTIRPKVDGLVITPIQIDENKNLVVYLVEIPQSTTAHQAADYRYYKRYNSISIPMDDYEIRDIMGRRKSPHFEVFFKIKKSTHIKRSGGIPYGLSSFSTPISEEEIVDYVLEITAKNIGSVYANYINAFFSIPSIIISNEDKIRAIGYTKASDGYIEYSKDNTVRDVVDVKMSGFESILKYGPSRYDPILPKLSKIWEISLINNYELVDKRSSILYWEIYADNANPLIGECAISDIEIQI